MTNIIENLEGEEWKDIQGYEAYYQISNYGRVRSLDRDRVVNKNGNKCKLYGRIMKTDKSYQYEDIYLCKEGVRKKHFIHRLIAIHFIDNPCKFPCVNHINGLKTDNRIENLEWCSYSKNNKHAYDVKLKKPYERHGEKNPRAKYSNIQRQNVYKYHIEGKSLREISILCGIKSKSTIHNIIKSFKHINNKDADITNYWQSCAVTSGGKKLKGLVSRRKSEVHLYLTGEVVSYN